MNLFGCSFSFSNVEHRVFRLVSCALAVGFLLGTLTGCNPGEQQSTKLDETAPVAAVPLKLLVIDDPQLAQQINLLRGEWKAQTDANLEVAELSVDQLPAEGPLNADVVIYPTSRMGDLAASGRLTPLTAEQLANPALGEPDILDLVRLQEMTWGRAVLAVPFGDPLFVLYYRADLLQGRQPPPTWRALDQLAGILKQPAPVATSAKTEDASAPSAAGSGGADAGTATASPDESRWSVTLEPLAPGWAGRTFLARAAAYAKHRDYYQGLFDAETMEPLIAGEPFVLALENILAGVHRAQHDQTTLTPTDVRREFLAGRAGMALTWPTSERIENVAGDHVAYGIAELPGSQDVFNPKTKVWQRRNNEESVNVPLLGIAGRLGSITAESKYPDAAAHLLARLSGDPWGTAISSASTATAPYRAAQTFKPEPWTGGTESGDAAKQYGEALTLSFGRANSLSVPRIPGNDRYMAALDKAVIRAAKGEQEAKAALASVADEWTSITTELGLEAQKAAYLQSLGRTASN